MKLMVLKVRNQPNIFVKCHELNSSPPFCLPIATAGAGRAAVRWSAEDPANNRRCQEQEDRAQELMDYSFMNDLQVE